jgi:nitroimidazol reductase NimA-like FMN-containing flavoprotein (pyridoxamine 5'-phosphate oxidase superfamily)
MTTPVTVLDQRYSDPKASAVGWEATLSILKAAELSWISTVRADGRPHVTPLVAVWTDDSLYFHTGAKEQKFVNLRVNPNVVLTTGCNRWDEGVDVVVEGKAVRVTDENVLARVAEAFTAKWDGRWQLVVRDGRFYDRSAEDWPSEVFAVSPTRVFAHAKGDPFGATTHRFSADGTF